MRLKPYFDSFAQGLRENLLALIKVNDKPVDLNEDGSVNLEIRNIDIDTLEGIKNSCEGSKQSSMENARRSQVFAEGSDPDVVEIGGKHSSKVASAVASAYAEAPFGESVGEHIHADGAIINADVTKTSVDTAIGVSAAGSENKVYAQNGDWVNLPIGDSNGANTDLSNLSPVGQGVLERKADLIKGKIPEYQLPDSFLKQKMGYEIYSFSAAVRPGVVYSLMQMDEVRVPAEVFAAPGNTIGFAFTGDEGPGFGANVFFSYPYLENMEALQGHIRPVEGGVSVDMGNAGLDRLIVTTDSQLHPVVAEAVFHSGVLSRIHVRANTTMQPGYEYYTDTAVELTLPRATEEDSEGEYYVYSGDGSIVWLDSGYNLDGDLARIAGDALHTHSDGRKYLSMGTGGLVHVRLRQYQNEYTGLPELKIVDLSIANRFGTRADTDLSNLTATGTDRLLRHRWVHLGEFLSANTIHQVIYPGWVITDNHGAIRFRPNDMIGMSRYGTQVDGIEITEGTLVDGERLGIFYVEHTESAPNGFRINVGGAEIDGALDKVIIVKGDEPGLWYVVEAQFRTERRANTDLSNLTPEGEARFNAKADASSLTAHTGDSAIHVTGGDRETWNAKLDASALTPYAKTEEVDQKLTGYATTGAVTDLSGKVNDNQAATDVVLSGLLTDKADKAVKPAELTGTSVTVRPSGYYTWNAAGACTIEFTGWDAEKLQTSELHVSTAVGATLAFPAGTVIKGDTITGGLPYDISISHDAEGYVAVIMERV